MNDVNKILTLQKIAKSYTREKMYKLNIEYYDKIQHIYEKLLSYKNNIDTETEYYEENG